MGLQRHIGDKNFYRMALAVALPIMIQNAITNFVGMLDNIMVGQVGTAQMSGVASSTSCYLYSICAFSAPSPARVSSPPSSPAPRITPASATPSGSRS